jgi:hypothetical protein
MRFRFYLYLFLSGLVLISCAKIPPKPEIGGQGPLKIELDNKLITSPEFHNPLEQWKAWHMFYVNNGLYNQRSCMYCHNPAKSCNNCHQYVGVKIVNEDAPDKTFIQGFNRLELSTNNEYKGQK